MDNEVLMFLFFLSQRRLVFFYRVNVLLNSISVERRYNAQFENFKDHFGKQNRTKKENNYHQYL